MPSPVSHSHSFFAVPSHVAELTLLFRSGGFREESFRYLDDLRTFHRFRLLNCAERCLWHALRSVGWRYPETCLLGVYRKPA